MQTSSCRLVRKTWPLKSISRVHPLLSACRHDGINIVNIMCADADMQSEIFLKLLTLVKGLRNLV